MLAACIQYQAGPDTVAATALTALQQQICNHVVRHCCTRTGMGHTAWHAHPYSFIYEVAAVLWAKDCSCAEATPSALCLAPYGHYACAACRAALQALQTHTGGAKSWMHAHGAS